MKISKRLIATYERTVLKVLPLASLIWVYTMFLLAFRARDVYDALIVAATFPIILIPVVAPIYLAGTVETEQQ